MAVRIQPMPIAAVVDLVNGWGSTPRSESGQAHQPYPDPNGLGSDLGIPAKLRASITSRDLTEVADQLHPVFAASDARRRVGTVAALLTLTVVRPTLDFVAGHPQPTWMVDEPRRAVLAAAALALRQQLLDHTPDRLGTCAGRNCADAYVDTSPAAHRRFCSVTCQNRARVALYRQRHATGPSDHHATGP